MASISPVPILLLDQSEALNNADRVQITSDGHPSVDGVAIRYVATQKDVLIDKERHVTIQSNRENLVEIKQALPKGPLTLYVDTKRGYVYPYIPMELTAKEALAKCCSINPLFGFFECELAFYNRHGVALIGSVAEECALFYAYPSDRHVSLQTDIEMHRYLGRTTVKANQHFHFVYSNKKAFLNHEEAMPIPLESSEQESEEPASERKE